MKSKNQIDQKELRRQKILSEPLLPLIVKMSVPTIVGMLIMVIYNLTDTFFVGLLNDKSMTAAIGVVFSFVSIMYTYCTCYKSQACVKYFSKIVNILYHKIQ